MAFIISTLHLDWLKSFIYLYVYLVTDGDDTLTDMGDLQWLKSKTNKTACLLLTGPASGIASNQASALLDAGNPCNQATIPHPLQKWWDVDMALTTCVLLTATNQCCLLNPACLICIPLSKTSAINRISIPYLRRQQNLCLFRHAFNCLQNKTLAVFTFNNPSML